jgi:SnoaL-like protein
MTDWAAAHELAVDRFTKGWRQPDPHAWDELLTDDVELNQPLVASGTGVANWHDEMRRLLVLAPDLRGRVLAWAGRGEDLFIDVELTATIGGRPVSIRSLDRLRVTEEGRVRRRDAFFDPTVIAAAVVSRPSAWWRWWRSGIGPLTVRRRFLPS